MKKYLIKVISLIILFILIIGTHYSSCEAYPLEHEDEAETIDTDIMGDTFLNDFNPNGTEVNKVASPFISVILQIANPVLGIIQVIGGFLMVVSIAMFGFNLIVSSNGALARDLKIGGNNPEKTKDLLDYGRSLLIGSVLLFTGATLVKLIFNVLVL